MKAPGLHSRIFHGRISPVTHHRRVLKLHPIVVFIFVATKGEHVLMTWDRDAMRLLEIIRHWLRHIQRSGHLECRLHRTVRRRATRHCAKQLVTVWIKHELLLLIRVRLLLVMLKVWHRPMTVMELRLHAKEHVRALGHGLRS